MVSNMPCSNSTCAHYVVAIQCQVAALAAQGRVAPDAAEAVAAIRVATFDWSDEARTGAIASGDKTHDLPGEVVVSSGFDMALASIDSHNCSVKKPTLTRRLFQKKKKISHHHHHHHHPHHHRHLNCIHYKRRVA